MDIVINGSNDIFLCYVLGNKLMDIFLNGFSKGSCIIAELFNEFFKHRIINQFRYAKLLGLAFNEVSYIDHKV